MNSKYNFISFDDVTSKDHDPNRKYNFISFDPKKEKELQKENDSFDLIRTATQIPQGALESTGPGLISSGLQFLGQGEVNDPEEMDRIREISEREGIPFDEEKYKEASKNALEYFPTVGNIARIVEEQTGIPLDPKEWYQKALRMGSMVHGATPGTNVQKLAAGTTAPVVSQIAQKAGIPEQFADLLGFAAGGFAGNKTPEVEFSLTKRKPSGLPERQFESIKETKQISEKKLNQINEKLENDFTSISDKIIEESPIGETSRNLSNDPTYKQESREILNQAQEIADSLPDVIVSSSLKKEMADISSKKMKGVSASEYDKNYNKFMKEAIEDILPENTNMGGVVEQYRKNNADLSEYFEPGASKALNRAKKDALLDQNRAIANIIEKSNPKLAKVFKEGNDRWSKIMDVEAVESFVNEIFEGKVNYKKMHNFWDKNGLDRIFKRALGEVGYKKFDILMKDMITSEVPYKMLKIAKSKGFFKDTAETVGAFILHPTLGKAKLGIQTAKRASNELMNSMLDKPKLSLSFQKAVKELKKGDFAASEKSFKKIIENQD